MVAKLYEKSAVQCANGIKKGDFSCVNLIESLIDRIDRYDHLIKAWQYLDRDLVILSASKVDEKINKKLQTGNLAGIPVGVKDIFNTQDMPTEMGSPIWEGFTPGNDARVVARLRLWDMIIMGKTVTAEFAVHTPNQTRNPHNIEYSPGTSSSGSAAAVAAGMVPIALGTQTAGSIIRPASYCGVFGFKPSFGLIPRTGMLKTTDSLDTVGFFTKYVEDIRPFLDEVIVTGKNWPISYDILSNKYAQEKKSRPWKLLVIKTHMWNYAKDYVSKAFDILANRMSNDKEFELIETALPVEFEEAHETHRIIYDKTLTYYFKEEYKSKKLISQRMYEIISRGKKISLNKYKAALDKQNLLRHKLENIISVHNCDAIVTNSTSSHAPKYMEDDILDSCLIWTLTSSPVIGMPAFKSPEGLPFGIQLIGKRYYDYLLITLGEYMVEAGYVNESNLAAVPKNVSSQTYL